MTIANWLTGSFAGMVVTGYKLCKQLVELKYYDNNKCMNVS